MQQSLLSNYALIVLIYPSLGKAASALACTRSRMPFIPIDLIGPKKLISTHGLNLFHVFVSHAS